MKTAFILSVSSDIGVDLASRYLSMGYRVIGTYRNRLGLKKIEKDKNCILIKCDVTDSKDISRLALTFKKDKLRWEIFISCVGYPLPVVSFFQSRFDEWADSVNINSLAQLHVLHSLFPYRNLKKSDVIFFAGGGMNSAVLNFSAYTISKIMLTKMCEFLDLENKDLKIFIVGPGWTRTKIHETILNDRRTDVKKILETKKFMQSNEGTSFKEIFDSIEWLRQQDKEIVSGRNFSVVHDPWRVETRNKLVKALKNDVNMYKLRRHGNNYLQ